ncbi:Putative TP73 antisense gene protein 1 [Chelonia mydas]|uniref:Putative TP73 antisense gene protein 1 n=1 Tax=Chelonia mydas TaxID=8469 RepID=M7B1I3_CHEMY|nr:Putative TP73 antisense gene protein 1 [Chelonia mydas]
MGDSDQAASELKMLGKWILLLPLLATQLQSKTQELGQFLEGDTVTIQLPQYLQVSPSSFVKWTKEPSLMTLFDTNAVVLANGTEGIEIKGVKNNEFGYIRALVYDFTPDVPGRVMVAQRLFFIKKDIDECVEGMPMKCLPEAECINRYGSYFCRCPHGFEGDGLYSCVDRDECARGIHNCNQDATCLNTLGSYFCVCQSGFIGDGIHCKAKSIWSPWSPWSVCTVTCGYQNQMRIRLCTHPESGMRCEGPSADLKLCPNLEPCPIDGMWSPWASWTPCPISCGLGVVSRSRRCNNPAPEHGGKNCTGHGYEEGSCGFPPSFILSTNPCITSTGTSYSMVPSPPSYHKSLIPVHPSAISSTTSVMSAREDQTPSTSTSHPSAFAALHMRNAPVPSKQSIQRLVISEASNSVASGGSVGRYSSSGTSGNNIGLALFGVGLGNKALFQSLMEENGCCLLYIVEDQLPDVERAFNTEFLANTRVLRQQDADIVLNDQRVSGAIVCSPPEAASEIVIDALRADMAYLKDADTVAVSMKFPSGAIVTLDVSQHCTKSCDQRLEVHGSQGTLRVDNQNPLGITEHGTSVSIYSQTQADRYKEAYRELFRHFLRTLKGKEPPVITKEQFLWTIQVAAAAEQSWRNGSAVDLRNEAIDVSLIKTEIM